MLLLVQLTEHKPNLDQSQGVVRILIVASVTSFIGWVQACLSRSHIGRLGLERLERSLLSFKLSGP